VDKDEKERTNDINFSNGSEGGMVMDSAGVGEEEEEA